MIPVMSNVYHTSVLLQACIDMLNIRPDGVYVDLTFGGGGHSAAMLSKLNDKGRLYAFDQDADAAANALKDPRFTLIPANFRFLKNYLRLQGVKQVDGILGDLGVSSHQFDEAERGFSIRFEGALDMRMNKAAKVSARDIVNGYDTGELIRIFRNYAEVNNAGKLGRCIETARQEKDIETTTGLIEAIKPATPVFEKNKYLARVFQALRIEVNQEMAALEECLEQCRDVLKGGGRLVIISYHSLEDRLVKNMIRAGNIEGTEKRDPVFGTTEKIFRNLTTKPVVPDEKEIQENPRARSARLRAAEKIKD
jgi:16S rRNA (cytosine1402-N4)-methyltransferase